jgi:hypothetical protein
VPVALELYFDQDSDAHVRGLWERLERTGVSSLATTSRSSRCGQD